MELPPARRSSRWAARRIWEPMCGRHRWSSRRRRYLRRCKRGSGCRVRPSQLRCGRRGKVRCSATEVPRRGWEGIAGRLSRWRSRHSSRSTGLQRKRTNRGQSGESRAPQEKQLPKTVRQRAAGIPWPAPYPSENYTTGAAFPCSGRRRYCGCAELFVFSSRWWRQHRSVNAFLRAFSGMGCPLRIHYGVIPTRHHAACSLTLRSAAPTLSSYLSEESVRSTARLCLVVLLVTSLLDVPAFAANEKPLGLVIQAQQAHLDNASLTVGTSVFSGDSLVTEAGGALRLKLGGSQLYLLSESAATLAQNATVVHAVVARGTVGFSSNGADNIELEIPQGILRAADGQPAYGQVTILSPLEVVISAYRGALVLDNEGDLHIIPAGKNYRVTMELEPAEQQAPTASSGGDNPIVQPRTRRRRRRLAFYLIFAGAVAGLSYVIWDHLSESPYNPHQ